MLTSSEDGLSGASLQQPKEGSPVHGCSTHAYLGAHPAGAREAGVHVQAAVVVWMHSHSHSLHAVNIEAHKWRKPTHSLRMKDMKETFQVSKDRQAGTAFLR